jgi:hypothetical protein
MLEPTPSVSIKVVKGSLVIKYFGSARYYNCETNFWTTDPNKATKFDTLEKLFATAKKADFDVVVSKVVVSITPYEGVFVLQYGFKYYKGVVPKAKVGDRFSDKISAANRYGTREAARSAAYDLSFTVFGD